MKVLKDKAQIFSAKACEGVWFYFRDISIFQENVACAYGIDGGNAVEQRCLSGTGRTHDSKKFSGVHTKADILNGLGKISSLP